MYIETDRLILRSLELTDEKAFVEMASDGTLNEIFGDCGECDKWMKDWLAEAISLDKEDNPNREYLAYAILEKKRNIVVGSVGCSFYEDLNKTGITYFIGSSYRKKGYASEAVAAYVKYFLEHYNANEMIATVKRENEASCKTVENAGFTLQETKRYQDINDEKAELYNFYSVKRGR